MPNEPIEVRLARYENLIRCTTQRFRKSIPRDIYADEDIEQELRIKAWTALNAYDPTRGHQESKWVFMCLTNRVKSLCSKKEKPETSFDFTDPTSETALQAAAVSGRAFTSDEERAMDIIDSLPTDLQGVAISIAVGFSSKEIAKNNDISLHRVNAKIRKIREYISANLQ